MTQMETFRPCRRCPRMPFPCRKFAVARCFCCHERERVPSYHSPGSDDSALVVLTLATPTRCSASVLRG
jgi:hypothetical protein